MISRALVHALIYGVVVCGLWKFVRQIMKVLRSFKMLVFFQDDYWIVLAKDVSSI